MSEYEPPAITEIGRVEDVTQGKYFSRVDGNSGTGGNNGTGNGGVGNSGNGPE